MGRSLGRTLEFGAAAVAIPRIEQVECPFHESAFAVSHDFSLPPADPFVSFDGRRRSGT
jgi:hypothetical protein